MFSLNLTIPVYISSIIYTGICAFMSLVIEKIIIYNDIYIYMGISATVVSDLKVEFNFTT